MIARRTPIARGAPQKRGKRPKARNAKRRKTEFARCYHSVERVEWIAAGCCVACFAFGCENAHIAGEGIGRKGNYDKIIRLCPDCHRLQHQIGAGAFAIRYRLDLRELAASTQRSWLEHSTEISHAV